VLISTHPEQREATRAGVRRGLDLDREADQQRALDP
jgi:hypothetical protein